ncbi:MAG: glycosyltransferase family A protein [Syntrophorhabdaceae bacterium]|nr:glycosyltransferase family A protein [Syntrophorhabdaceae bacterium]
MQPQIFVITCDRKPEYIHASLKSMFSQDSSVSQVHLVVCGSVPPESKYLEEYEKRADCKFYVHRPSTYERDACASANNYTRIVRNTLRAFALSDDYRPMIFCEDDCKFSKNWLSRALRVADILPEVATEYSPEPSKDFVLALYSPYSHKPEQVTGKPSPGFASYHPNDFFGNVCLYITPGAKGVISSYMNSEIQKPGHAPCDIMVRRACWDNKIPIFAMAPSVVDHTGDSSSKGTTEIIRAPSFLLEEPKI